MTCLPGDIGRRNGSSSSWKACDHAERYRPGDGERLERRIRGSLTIWIGKCGRPNLSVRFSDQCSRDGTRIHRIFAHPKRTLPKGTPQLGTKFNGGTTLWLSWPDGSRALERLLKAIYGQDMLTNGMHPASVNSMTRVVEEQVGIPQKFELSRIAAEAGE